MILNGGDKIPHPFFKKGFGFKRVDAEISVSPVQKVFGDHLPDQAVIHSNEWTVLIEFRGPQFHGGQAGLLDGVSHFPAECSGYNAVAIPFCQPRWWFFQSSADLHKGRPGLVLIHPPSHSGQGVTGVAAMGFDQKRHSEKSFWSDDGKPYTMCRITALQQSRKAL